MDMALGDGRRNTRWRAWVRRGDLLHLKLLLLSLKVTVS